MGQLTFLVIFLLDALVRLGAAQHLLRERVGPWRHRIQWENNGNRFSLLSTGTQYRPSSQARRRTQLLPTATNSYSNRVGVLVAPSRITRTRLADTQDHSLQSDASVLGTDGDQYLLLSGRPGTLGRAPPRVASTENFVTFEHRSLRTTSNGSAAVIPDFSGSGVPHGGRSTAEDNAAAPRIRQPDLTHSRGSWMRPERSELIARSSVSVPGTDVSGTDRRIPERSNVDDALSPTEEANVSPAGSYDNALDIEVHFPRSGPGPGPGPDQSRNMGDPSDPHSIYHRNSVFYNVYPPDLRNRNSERPSPGTGYGTRFFHNGGFKEKKELLLLILFL